MAASREPRPLSGGRSYSFEILLQSQGRWIIDCLMDREADAVQRARALLAQGRGEAVKVVRHRSGPGGTEVKREVLHERRAAAKDAAFRIPAEPDAAPVCESLAELRGLAGRMTLATLFRRSLVEQRITPSELLYDWRYLRRLHDDNRVLAAAIHKVAAKQAGDGSVAQRRACLEALVEEGIRRTRDLHGHKSKLPILQDSDVEAASGIIVERFGTEAHDEVFLLAVCERLAPLPNLSAKLDMLLRLIAGAGERALETLLEGPLADCLGFPEVVSEIFPESRRLADFLDHLIDFLKGNSLAATTSPQLKAIGYLMEAGRAPSCRFVLLDRLQRELAGPAPLDANEPKNEARCLETLRRALKLGDGGWLGGDATRTALESRRRRLRQEDLRRMGLDSTADSLRAPAKH